MKIRMILLATLLGSICTVKAQDTFVEQPDTPALKATSFVPAYMVGKNRWLTPPARPTL